MNMISMTIGSKAPVFPARTFFTKIARKPDTEGIGGAKGLFGLPKRQLTPKQIEKRIKKAERSLQKWEWDRTSVEIAGPDSRRTLAEVTMLTAGLGLPVLILGVAADYAILAISKYLIPHREKQIAELKKLQ